MSILDPQYIDAIKGSEGYAPQASWDYKQYSSGYGTKAQPGDENIPADQRKQVYEQRFNDEVGKAANSVDSFAPNLPPGVRAALTSLTYNAGPGWQQSGLGQAIKSGDLDKAQQIFLQYNKAGGQTDPGLVARRQREAAWFSGNPQAPNPQAAATNAQASSAAAPMAPQAPQPGPPLAIAPQLPSAPVFAPQQQAAPQAQEAPAFAQIPDMQAPPIFYAPRKPVALSALKSAFRAPVFPRG